MSSCSRIPETFAAQAEETTGCHIQFLSKPRVSPTHTSLGRSRSGFKSIAAPTGQGPQLTRRAPATSRQVVCVLSAPSSPDSQAASAIAITSSFLAVGGESAFATDSTLM
jgi:hypothetical protein